MASALRPGVASRRVQKELEKMRSSPVDGIQVQAGSDATQWIVNLTGAAGTIYAGERYNLRVKFPDTYPIDSPEVVFLEVGGVGCREDGGECCLTYRHVSLSPLLPPTAGAGPPTHLLERPYLSFDSLR